MNIPGSTVLAAYSADVIEALQRLWKTCTAHYVALSETEVG